MITKAVSQRESRDGRSPSSIYDSNNEAESIKIDIKCSSGISSPLFEDTMRGYRCDLGNLT